ncbi:hypothetical protein PAECIP111892_00617 [Paenibacillus auburnensis]|uniref:DUF4129 domain-containing protein n=1 Tax=Paenibacillus auburnensis TaxID=2905649 RepID=A0ABN8G0D6_9BACL|nr:hypothetical protein [Paenibacillus auburnensis]CAH1191365.1 hypothetical protein PAECIP111892_00617 [Paenibacillus auburnensis]
MSTDPAKRLQVSLKLWLACVIVWLLFLPLWVLLEVYLPPERGLFPWFYVLPFLSLAGVLLRYVCSRRWMQLLAALLLGAAAGLICAGLSIKALPLVAVSVLFAYLGMNVPSMDQRMRAYVAGLTVYFAAAIVFARVSELQPSLKLLTWSGSLCLVLALFDSNISFLRYSSFSADSSRLPSDMRRHNRVFVLLFVAVAAALAAGAGKAIGTLLWNAARLIIGWLSRLLSGSEKSTPIETVPQAALPKLPKTKVHESGLLSMIFEIIFYGIGAAVLLLLLYLGLRWLYRNTGGLFRRAIDALLSMLRRESPQEHAAFQDEEENIFAWEKTVQGVREYWLNRLKPGGRRDRWESMNGSRERIRWLYRHWLGAKQAEGYEVKGFLTPSETGEDVTEWAENRKQMRKSGGGSEVSPDELLQLYNQARYGNDEASGKDLEQLKKQLKL